MLKTLTDIITSLGLIDGKVSVMTADQLDEFARNIPDKKISCNVFGVGGYSRNDADVLTKTVRICLLKQMPVNYDLATVDLAESEMSAKLLAIMDSLGDSPFVNAENQTAITPELLTYDRTTLLVYLDVDLFGNASDCGGSPCIPEFFNNYVTEKFELINDAVDEAEAAQVGAELAQSLSEDAQVLSENARDKSEQWAENPEDVEVEDGRYSSLHHASKSKQSSDLSEKWANEDEDVPVEDGFSSKHFAAKSAGSAQAAGQSEINASGYESGAEEARDKAAEWAENPEDTPVESGKFSALHWAAKAQAATENKVDKVAGKSLVDDTEIAKLATIDFEQEKTTPIDADSAGIWDSVLGKFVLTTWANIKATLKTYFDTLYEKLVNKQNSLAVDGTGAKYPTVDAVNAALILKADSIDLVEAKQSISTLENVLSDANINQEARVTASGVDTVSLPKTAANTGMQVQLFGQSAQNMVVNGDFRNGTTGWTSLTSSIGSLNGILSITGTGTASNPRARESSIFVSGQKYYIKSRFRVTNSVCNFMLAYSVDGVETRLISPVQNQWYEVSNVGNAVSKDFVLGHWYSSAEIASGKVMEVDYAYVINLTATFGAGNEPTKEQCDILFANYFEGSDNVLGTGRVRSVGVGGINPSALYINGGTLRSNGLIKDEIRKGTNGYELVQRINPADGTVLTTPTISPIPHAGLLNSNSNGTAYFEPIIADAGVYSSNLAIQLTDYPISSFESIRKYTNGTYTELNPATAVIASGGLSFTHPDLVSGDLVTFTYLYNLESTGRSMTLTHYDSRYVVKDTANTNVYKITPKITSGVLTWELTLV